MLAPELLDLGVQDACREANATWQREDVDDGAALGGVLLPLELAREDVVLAIPEREPVRANLVRVAVDDIGADDGLTWPKPEVRA